MIDVVTLKNVTDIDIMFKQANTEYIVEKGKTEQFTREVADHGLKHSIIQQDMSTGTAIFGLVEVKPEDIGKSVEDKEPVKAKGVMSRDAGAVNIQPIPGVLTKATGRIDAKH